MKTKMIKTLVMALGLVACAHAFADGNVYEIVPCTQNGTALSGPIASVRHPLVAGETVYFKLRMPRTLDMRLAGKQWTLVHHGMSDIIDDFFSPLMIGIYVSGQLTYARYVNYVDSSADIRDFIFSYTTKPGDFALPIRLAGNGGPVGYSDSSSEYLLLNSDKWTVEDGDGNAAVFQFGSTFEVPVSPAISTGRQLDYSLANAGFYVKSIGFDPAWESAAYWRMVHSGSTFTDSLTPRLVADSAPTNAVTLHVWSMNEDIIKIKGGREVEMTVGYEGGNPIKQTVHVGDVTFASGQIQVNFADMGFELEGGDQSHVGQFTNIVLSAYEDYSYNKSYVRQIDYVTVPVQCSEALPPTLIVEVDTATVVAPVREDGDMYRSTAQVSVYLSQAYEYPLEVTVTPSFAHGAWGDYVRFSRTQTEASVLPTATAPTVIIPANSTGKQTLFLYALRADENTQGDENNQIVLTPSFDDAAAATVITEIQKAGVWISAARPEIRTPSAGAEISSVSGDEYELTVAVADTVADLSDTTTGYQVWFKAGATAKGGFLDGYWIMKDGALVNKDDNSPLKVTYPSSGDQQSQIYVVSPISKKKSDPVTFTAHIAEARTSTVETTDDKNNVYNEGDQATFKVTLSDKNETGGTIYAFLKASDNAVAGMFSGTPLFVVCNDTDPTKTMGLAINKNQIATPESKIKLLDGFSEDAGGLSLTFEVVLCTTPQYSDDPNNRVAGYDSNYLNLTVFNVEPIIKRIEMNGFESEYDGYQFATVPKGMWQKFKAVVSDKGAYDLETGFKTKWTISRNGQQKGNVEIVGNPLLDENVYSNNFTQAGTWTVKCQVKDKDMDDWSAVTYSVTFEVLDSPHVTLAVEETYFEDNDRAKITVGLDYWDDNRIEPLVVRLAVSPYSDRPNPGLFKLDQRYFKETVGQIDYYEVALTGDDYSAFDIDVVELDGTSNAKFSIAGEVVTTDELPTSETPANEYYLAASKVLYVEDVLPVCTITPDPAATTNRIEVSGGLSNYTIRWNVRSDVDNDFSYTYAKWPEAGIKVTFGGCENAADGSTIITEPTSGEFKPNFGDAQGPVEVTLTIETKDGPLDTFTWYFYVRPSKFLKTYAAGPLDPKSQYGAGLEGLGSGHVVVRGGATTFSSATKYVMDWNCGMETDVSGYAFGYKVSDDETNPTLDNGGLDDGFDVAIDFAGNNDNTPIANYYTYAPADGKDSFFYLWVNITPDENGNPVDTPIGKIAPEIPGRDRSPQALRLPTEMTGDGTAYLKTHVEAIFSREYAVEDNLGDLNNDGIPDYLAVCHKWAGGILAEVVYGDFMENHWRPLDQTNIDEDYIPGVWQQSIEGNALEFKELASYSPYLKTAEPFKTFFEIRGFGGGLNYIDDNGMVISKPAFSEVEQKAWEAFVEANNDGKADTDPDWLDVTKPDLTKWSPVPRGNKKLRMDPTLEDTDGDGKPDGWEYFFWYMAKVWAPAASKPGTKKDGQLFVFERFNPNDIVRGIEIKAEDVLTRFHPCVDDRIGVKDYNPDFDGDGLTDLEELVIGTNPCHWDTDADHMCDGWEVMHSLDPLNGSKVGNPDGDFMAYTELSRYFAAEIPNADPNAPTTYVFDLGQELREPRDYETREIEMYAMKKYYDSNGFYIHTVSPKDANGDDNYPLYYYLDADGNMRYTVNENETDDDGNPLAVLRYTSMGAITIRDVPLTAALIAPEKLDANGRPYLYGLETDAPPIPIPAVWHWSYPMLDHKYTDADGNLVFRRGTYTIPEGTLLVNTTHILIHDQVHAAFGFDPRTGWYKNGAGYVADRWNPQINLDLAPTDSTGAAVNTDPYTDYDEYLVMRYRHDFGIRYYDDGKYDPGDIWATFSAFSTKPNIVYAKTDIEAMLNQTNTTESATTNATGSATTYDTETAANLLATANISEYLANAFAEAGSTKSPVKGHGADTDGDGVPDGWELYKYRNPNAAPSRPKAVGREGFREPWDKEELDGTPDGLGWTAEYAGTDSCNAYKDCPSIYNNHPGLHPAGEGFQQGWFNKFFPTDPDNPDTDGDGIFDGYEGLAWRGTWYNGGNTYIVAPTTAGMTFIYGNPQDSITCCVRGGGMNPCTVDTDIDGLPDPWEMSYAGIVVDALSRKYVGPADGFDPDIAEATFTSDGLNEAGLTISNVVYICGGMDATWGGDGFTDPIMDGNSTDALLGTVRDVDFDHDGLQNYQEYLVQQVRHFRYDDITTPLMGRYLDEGEYDLNNLMGPLLSDHVLNVAPGFTPMMQDADQFVMRTLQNWMDGVGVSFVTNTIGRTITVNEFTGAEMTNLIYEVVTNITPGSTIVADKYYGDGYHYMYSTPWVAAGWRQNGYMASPIHGWDRMITCDVIQPSILMPPAGAYVSTDPRVADTDGDGMDDYYEMFHGLNPILGSTAAGSKDIIAIAWGAPAYFNAFWNEWTHSDFNRYAALMGMPGSIADPTPLQAPAALDPLLYPWAMGAGEADPDGDGLRNDSERITANLTSPMTTHTDPTPLWYTDTSSDNSYVKQYYQNTAPVSFMPFWPSLIGFDDPYSAQTPDGGYGGFQFLYSFEENEGYDTDNDWKSDGREIVRTFRAPTDPLNFTDPARRQALYLDGDKSWVQSRATFNRDIFTGRIPSRTAVDFFKQFTAEAWIRPEKIGEQTILDRCSLYGYDAINKDKGAIRTNFRLGLTDEGKVYGMFDNDDARVSVRADSESCQTVIGSKVPTNEWTHVALTYDGKRLVLYVNGSAKANAPTHLIPANGVTAIIQDPTYTNAFTQTSYEAVPGAFFIGGRPETVANNGADAFDTDTISYDSMKNDEWFKGYIDEVRIWDGARTETEIAQWYNKHMTMDDAATNRLEVYTHLMGPEADSSRNDNDGLKDLTAELVQLYDFSDMPGAVNADDVAQNASGFDNAVRGQLVSRAGVSGDFTENVGWWDSCQTKSTAYGDYAIVPWVKNTVHHLPVMDGSVVDSFLYSDYLGGYTTPASRHDLQRYALNNSAMPYPFYNYFLERYQRLFKLNQLAETDPENETLLDLVCRYEYEIRSDFIGTADLVPMGGAYSKPCPEMWDGQGSSDLWELTKTDSDGDGIPDWWETENGLDPNDPSDWAKTITWKGAAMPAWEAYLRDLARGMMPDGNADPVYASTSDIDGDGLLDWWQNIYALEQGAAGDDDGDGLSNYVEYMLSEVFTLKSAGEGEGKWIRFAPDNACSVNLNVSDYFYRLNKLYIGEIFTDHDRIKDQWESTQLIENSNVSPYAYDADIDADADGWSNEAEFQSGTKPTVLASLTVDAVQLNEYPVPTIELTVSYHGTQNIGDKPVVAQAWSDQTLATIPDAVWTLGGQGDVQLYENGASNVVTGVKHFGMNPLREMLIHLSPGSVVPGSIEFEFKDLAWILYNTLTDQGYTMDPAFAVWEGQVIDQPRNDGLSMGDIVRQGYPDESFGTINYATGELKVDFAKFPAWFAMEGDISQSTQGNGWVSVYNLQKSYVRVNWQSKLLSGGRVNTYYLAEADVPGAGNNSLGHVKQGLNTLVAFCDLDSNGKYTPGEPYGMVRDVDVGWNYARASIGLTDTHPSTPRYDLTKGGNSENGAGGNGGTSNEAATDREVIYPSDATDVYTISNGNTAEAKGKVRVRIARFAIDSMNIGLLPQEYMAIVYDRVHDLTETGRQVITEADILNMASNAFDIDWNSAAFDPNHTTLASVIQAMMPQNGTPVKLADGKTPVAFTNIYYTVYVGNDPIIPLTVTNANILSKAIVRKFGMNRVRPTPIPGATLLEPPAPTFQWRCDDTTYTAFRVRVTGNGVNWTSSYMLLPPRDASGVYSWTPPLRIGAIVPGGTAEFKNGKTYSWEISTYNSKYRDDLWTSGGSFVANVLTNSMDYATARIAVRYYGPDEVASSGKIRVQAFKTPDFSGDPVGEGYVTSLADISSANAIKTANATIVGLKTGSYYIRAFIDTDGNGTRSFWTSNADKHYYWESWGCYCTRDLKLGTIFTPRSITVGPGYGANEIIPVYIEDCDTDRDSLPDAWEWKQNGNLTTYGAASIDQNAGGFAMKKSLSGSIETKGALSSGLAVMAMSNLKSPRVAALLLGVNASGTDSQVNSRLNSTQSDASAEPSYVAIKAIELDRDNGKVFITTETAGKENGSTVVLSDIYEFASGSSTLTLTCNIWHRDSLESGDWRVIETRDVEINKTSTTYEFDLATDVDLASGFFKATLEK